MPHIHDLIDFTVAVYIVHENKVLLVDHKKLKTWMPIGGHIELDEDPEEALIREIQEESGLTVEIVGGNKAPIQSKTAKSLLAPLYMDIHDITSTHRHIGLVYFAKSVTEQVLLAGKEHYAIRWFTKNELPDPQLKIHPLVRFYAKEALSS